MKKKICSLMLACCVIFASAFVLISCGKKHNKAKDWSSDDTNHWKICLDEGCDKVYDFEEHDFTETIIEATIDGDGKITKTCSVCSKVIETVIPKIQQTKTEMIDVLVQAVKAENYSVEVQEEYTKRTNTQDYHSALSNEIITYETNCLTEGGTAVSFKKDASLGAEAVTSGKFLFKENNDYVECNFKLNNEKTAVVPDKKLIVGSNYSRRYINSQVMSNLDYLLEINSEATAQSVLKNILDENVKRYQTIFEGLGDEFTYDSDDIQVNLNIAYESGRYFATGTIELDELNHTGAAPTKTVDSFKIYFVIVYTSKCVEQNYSKFSYVVDETPEVLNDELTEIYIEQDYRYEVSSVNIELIAEVANVVEGLNYDLPEIRQEQVRYYIDGTQHSFEEVDFNAKINTKVDEFIQFCATSEGVLPSRIEVYLDSEHTIEYDPAVDVFAEDFFGADIYLVILPQA